jgi:8-oxo-dGTP diphosphatase
MKKSENPVALVVEAILKNKEGKILLLKRSDYNTFFVDLWQLPGGKVEFGENVHQAISREILEETTCVVEADLGKVHSFYEEFNGFKGTLFLMVFSGSCNGEIKLSEDHTEFGFFSEEEIKKLELTSISKKSLFG